MSRRLPGASALRATTKTRLRGHERAASPRKAHHRTADADAANGVNIRSSYNFALCILASAAIAAEPIRWSGGGWDDAGAPKGRLLTDNDGWWGRSVYTGVTYAYADEPASPRDIFKGNASLFGRRLLDGDAQTGWHRPVGALSKKPVDATFDFKRRCSFTEIDLIAEKSPSSDYTLAFSADGEAWGEAVAGVASNRLTRHVFDAPAEGRYLRLTFKSRTGPTTWLDEVMAWGDAEVSEAAPEAILPYPDNGALTMTDRTDAGIMVAPLTDPSTLDAPEYNGTCAFEIAKVDEGAASCSLSMARNETETRYFAVVNGTAEAKAVALAAPAFPKNSGLSCEMRIGGLVRVEPPKRRLTDKEKFDMVLTGELPEGDPDRLDVLPFFSAAEMPEANFLRKNTANAAQISGFPGAVRLAPGEGCVLMLRFRSDAAAPGLHSAALKVDGGDALACSVRVVDCTLPDSKRWIFPWAPFTSQFPFESRTRFDRDVALLRDLGVNVAWGLPTPGTKVAALAKGNPGAMFFLRGISPDRHIDQVLHKGGDEALTAEDAASISNHLEKIKAQVAEAGVDPAKIMLAIRDEPNRHNAKQFRAVAEIMRRCAPEFGVYMNPSFWQVVDGKGAFAPAETVIGALGSYYPGLIDISVPYRSNVESKEEREALWCVPRRVNAQYAHPAHRAGRSIAWSSFRYGMDGFAYWCYYSPRGNPWDIRTWNRYAYETMLVFPLENGAAPTPVYEEMREAWEDWRLLDALRQAGKDDVLKALLAEFAASYDEPRRESCRPYTCDFLKLRDKALDAFAP